MPQTPHYSENLQEIKNGFYELFDNDSNYIKQDFDNHKQLQVTPREESLDGVMKLYPDKDWLREPDPEPFGEFMGLSLNVASITKQEGPESQQKINQEET